MTKEYKPGQFVSLGGKLHRVKKKAVYPCEQCSHIYCGNKLLTECLHKLGTLNYPELIKPKR